ncbi:hypothetical protein PYW07_004730 [Mythimna separata]|uniref:Uncharacterized protein n=1 Tax=Mythimna separata TaxID=271217 RepID=A0AAD7YY82_MYTSE|nr:hypothetical protein PYW07_004730 [Mythimna separata]
MWLCFSEKMCVRNAFVLVLLSVSSRAQLDANSMHEYSNISENLGMASNFEPTPGLPHIQERPVKYAGIPQNLTVSILPLQGSDNELQFNVSWSPSLGRAAKEYSVEILSEKNTPYCTSPVCYRNPIPGNSTWVLIPETVSQIVDEDCPLYPGCSYIVILNAHPWDGNTNLTRRLDLEDCVAGVCSCAHSRYLPAPDVTTNIVMSKEGDMFTNIIWTLPKPSEPQWLLPAKLRKQSYVVSLNKQIVLNKIDSAWFKLIYKRTVEIDGLVSEGDTTRSLLLPLSKRETSDTPKPPSAKILATVQLVDDRGCIGPYGNETAFEPEKPTENNLAFGVYVTLVALGALLGALAMGAVFVVSARIAKRVLKSLRPAPVCAPLEPLKRRPTWFPFQLRTYPLSWKHNGVKLVPKGGETFEDRPLKSAEII